MTTCSNILCSTPVTPPPGHDGWFLCAACCEVIGAPGPAIDSIDGVTREQAEWVNGANSGLLLKTDTAQEGTRKPSIPEVVERFRAYHRKHPAWGSLHIVLDDFNVKDDSVRFCVDYAVETGDAEGAELARILLAMSKTQRLKLANLRP